MKPYSMEKMIGYTAARAMGVDLRGRVGPPQWHRNLLEGLVVKLLAGKDGQGVALFIVHHTVDAIERDLLDVRPDDVDGICR